MLFKQAVRILLKNRSTTLLLLSSLVIGITVYVLVSARVSYHKSYDTHFRDYENIYQIVSSAYTENVLTISQPRTQRVLGKTLEESYPEVKKSGFFCGSVNNHYTIGDHTITNDKGYHSSKSVIELFSIEIIRGNSVDFLSRPNMVLISESFSRRYFGDVDPIGRTILQYPAQEFEIEAVFRDLPGNTHFSPDLLISFHDNMHLPPPLMEDWGEFSFYTYLELESGSDVNLLESRISRLCAEKNKKQIKESESEFKFGLQPIKDIHTRSHLKNEISQNIRGDYLNILLLISVFILIASGFNFVYFSYSRISGNAVQYGIRKAIGARDTSIFTQFLIESFLIHALALLISLLIVAVIQELSHLFYGNYSFKELTDRFWIALVIVVLSSCILNPLVLAILLHKKTALSLLTEKSWTNMGAFSFKQLFTILQFVIVVFLVSSIFGINSQINFLKKKDKGIDIANKLVIKTPSYMRRTSQRVNNLEAFEYDIANISGIQNVATSNIVPGDIPSFNFSVTPNENLAGIKTAIFIADSSFINAFGIQIVEGDRFHRAGPDDCIINAVCLKQLGYDNPGDILGKILYLSDESGIQRVESRVKGVCRDFNFTSVKELPGPIILLDWTEEIMWGRYTLTFDDHSDKQELLSEIEHHFQNTFPNYPFAYDWLEDYYNDQFDEENSIIIYLKNFALVAIMLGILSLLAMVRQISKAKIKEIGIRKVNGATVADIIILLNLHFVKWIGVAWIIAVPSSWYFLVNWLHNFAYKDSIGIWIFLVSGGGALFISSLTVTLQSYKTARMDPAESIRYD